MKIVVIGAGMGGMTSAARLARGGHEVAIYEASDQVGGKCRTEWIGRVAFDTGPSLLTLPAVYKDFFQRTGKPMGLVCPIETVNPAFDYRFADESRVKFANLSRKETLDAIAESFGEQASAQWDQIMRRAEAMWDVSRGPFVESELKSPFSLLKRITFFRDLLIIAPWKSLRKHADEILKDQHLRFIMDRYATYSGSDPRKAPAVLSTIAFVEEGFGAWHVKGGLGNLAVQVHERAKDVGVTFHLNSPVAQINIVNGKATGIVLASGERVDADAVIANADASLVYNKLISGNNRRLKQVRRNIAKADVSVAGFSLLLGMRKDVNDGMNHHTVLFPKDYDAEFDAIFRDRKPVARPTIYICAPKDPLMSKDENLEGWFVLVNAPTHGSFDWSDEDFNQKYASQIIDQIEEQGIAIRSRLETMTVRTPADLESQVLAPGGAIYGTSSNGARAAFLRAKNRSPIKGLYLVGGSAHPGGGLPLVGISADLVSQAIGFERKLRH
jgi:phytoene desaturase